MYVESSNVSPPKRDEPLTVAEVAEMTCVDMSTLGWWRCIDDGRGPKLFKLGRRVMYRRADVEKWVEEAADGS